MKQAINNLKDKAIRRLAKLSGRGAAWNIMSLANIEDDGTIRTPGGRKIGSYDRSTGIGRCSLIGYLALLRECRTAA